jgi:hypothetical protein
MTVKPAGSDSVPVRFEQLAKAAAPIVVAVLGMVSVPPNPVQPLKALEPIDVTRSGNNEITCQS